MAIRTRKIGLYAVTGTVLAVIVIAAVFAAGVQFPSVNQPKNQLHTGTLAVYIKDAPVDLSELNVTIDGLEVQSEGAGWTALNFTEGTTSVSFDLLKLENVTKDLSIAQLPAGNYSKIRLNVEGANATFVGSDQVVPLKVPSNKIDVIVKFEVKEGATTQVIIDMTADWVAISNSHNLRPVLKATVIPAPESTTSLGANLSTITPGETPTTAPSESPVMTPAETPVGTPATSSIAT